MSSLRISKDVSGTENTLSHFDNAKNSVISFLRFLLGQKEGSAKQVTGFPKAVFTSKKVNREMKMCRGTEMQTRKRMNSVRAS